MKETILYAKGIIHRWFRKHFQKKMSVIKYGTDIFQEFADIYNDNINNIDIAYEFFSDFIKETNGLVIVDFLDTDNWDCIRKIEVDKQSDLIWFYWQVLHNNPIEDMTRKMILPIDYYGLCLKFKNVRFIRNKKGKCLGICVNGYTIKNKTIQNYAKKDGWEIKYIDQKSSFFSTNIVRMKDNITQYWSFINTPISSFWIIPKSLKIHPQDSEKYLYQIGIVKIETMIKNAFEQIKLIKKLKIDQQEITLKTIGNEMRNSAENLFKLINCFYHEQNNINEDYDNLYLGELTKPLKKTIYTSDLEVNMINDIIKIANDLSHDSGNPVKIDNIGKLYINLIYFVKDFKNRIQKDRNIDVPQITKPSPEKYIKEHFKEICFKDEINNAIHQTTGKISYTIRADVYKFNLFDEKKWLLCKDGYFKNVRENDIVDVIKVWNRTEVITLIKTMEQKLKNICNDAGFDCDCSIGLTLNADLKKEGIPTHLFSEDEIMDLMINADDNNNNKLVIDEDGFARIIQITRQGVLYPVSQETWCAGNYYVGERAKRAEAHDSYVLCTYLWLDYLKTGKYQYSDLYIPDDNMDNIISEIKKYYLKQ